MLIVSKISEMVATEGKIPTKQESICEAGEHLLADFCGEKDGATLIVVGGIHGNEPAGVLALKKVLSQLKKIGSKLNGRVIFLAGNTRALQKGVRYIDADLNRHWTMANILINSPACMQKGVLNEDVEQGELLEIFQKVLAQAKGEVYVLDLHSTSAHGLPFVTLGDTIRNRNFAMNFPATIVLGIEEQLDGTMLEHMNNLGTVTLGFEGGQHKSPQTVDNHAALIWVALVASNCLDEKDLSEFENHKKHLRLTSGGGRFVEVRHRQALLPDSQFKMNPDYKNFQLVKRGDYLAVDKNGKIKAKETSLILMPLYQAQGDDGFFLVREVKSFWLKVSNIVRRMNLGSWIHLLPGVRKHLKEEGVFLVNTKIARFFPLQIFHLLGFRKLRWTDDLLVISRRLHDTTSPFVHNRRNFI